MAAARWLIAGEVQGVGFRWFAARHGQSLGLRGWVRNLPDGRVEVVAAGEETQLLEMAARLRAGPRFSRVEHVGKSDIPHEMVNVNSFEIR
ncbi:MAG: acylphosphatase [Gemmatimonadetes bacterium]|nr:acylphosphatase [Gemmatimonadota bacterium]